MNPQMKSNPTDERCISTVDGHLTWLDPLGYTFDLYLDRVKHQTTVKCYFKDDIVSDLIGALDRFIAVRGDCFYREDAKQGMPYKIMVNSIEVLPKSEDLPDWDDIAGIAPDLTGGLSSEEYVRRQRDEWDKQR